MFATGGGGRTTDSEDEDLPRIDIEVPTDPGDPDEGEGCKKVDFLFVIDSSPSMIDEQSNLLNSFEGFIEAIRTDLALDDFQLMVVDASQTFGIDCDGVLGAGRTTSALGEDCMLQGGNRYALPGQPDLVAAFTCMGSRGADGDANEQTMNSLTQAVGPLNAPGACNEGFVRDDALLVVTLITDEEDNPSDFGSGQFDGSCLPADTDPNSQGDPATWHGQLVDVKNGDPNAVVVLSLLGDCDAGGSCPGLSYDPLDPMVPFTGAEPAPRLRQFTELFTYGTLGPVCAPDYAPFFASAVSVIGTACDGFDPPG